MSKDDQGNGTAAAAARQFKWNRPMLGKTGTTEEYKSAAFIGATPDFAGAVQTFNDGTNPRPICVGAAALPVRAAATSSVAPSPRAPGSTR